MEYNINQDLQPFITIATQGRVANGKTSLITNLTGVNPMKFIKEIKKSYYKLNTLKLDNIVERFFIYDTLNQPLLLKPTDFSTDLNELYLPNEINSENFSPSHSRTTSTASTINDDNDF